MKCPYCSNNISATARYCPTCGKKLDVTFEEISRGMVSQEQSEKMQEKLRESRRLLAIAVFLLAVSLIIFAAVPAPRTPDAVPVYHVEVPEVWDVLTEKVEVPEFEIPE